MGNVFEIKNGSKYPFAIKANGSIIATSGEIAGWRISPGMGLEKNISASDSPDGQKYDIVVRSNPWGYNRQTQSFSPNEGKTNFGDGYAFAVYKSNSALFYVNYKGKLYAENADISGKITATSGSIGNWTINLPDYDNGSLTKTRTYSSTNSGKIDLGGNQYAIWVNDTFKVDYSGNMIANSGTFKGNLDAAGGTFKGELQAATGTFKGELKAATGTFKGELKAATGTFTGAISIKKNNNTIFSASSDGVSITGSVTASSFTMTNGTYTGDFKPRKLTYIKNLKTDDDGHIISIDYGYAYYVSTSPVIGGGGCFIAGTKILMANGSYKNIENIKENDLIISYNEINNKFVIDKVIKLLIHHNTSQLMTLILEDGTKIKSTLSHPFLTINGWKTIDLNMAFKEHSILCQKIKIGDILVGQNHNSKITDILYENCPINYDTYNLFVKKYHTYIANNYIVHNAIVIAKN